MPKAFNRLRSPRTQLAATLHLIAVLSCALGCGTANSHEGPPFPILEDRQVGGYVVSVWTDPDVGTATFYVVLESPRGQQLPRTDKVEIAVAPASGRLREAIYRAEPQEVRRGARYFAQAHLDRAELWLIRTSISSGVDVVELHSSAEATPDGTIGPVGLALYAFPFAAVAVLWLKAILVRRNRSSATRAAV